MGKSSAPSAPDPAATAQAEAKANRVTQITPQGNLIYGTLDKNGQFVPSTGGQQQASVIEQTPFQQQAQGMGEQGYLNLANSILPQASGLQNISTAGLPNYVSSLDFSKISPISTPDQFAGQAKQAQDAAYQSAYNLLQPDLQMQQRRTDQQLADKGLPIGSEAYNSEQDRIAREQGAQLNNLALNAVAAGNTQAGNLFQQAQQSRAAQLSDQLQQAQLAQSARQNTLGEQSGLRANQLQEIASLLGGSYNPTPAAQFTPGGQIDVTGPTNLAYQAQLAQYQNQQQQQAGLLNGLFGLGTAALFL